VLLLSKIGQEGHNLQAASVLTHLDLPWVPTGLEHFVARQSVSSVPHRRVFPVLRFSKRPGVEAD